MLILLYASLFCFNYSQLDSHNKAAGYSMVTQAWKRTKPSSRFVPHDRGVAMLLLIGIFISSICKICVLSVSLCISVIVGVH